MTDDTPKDNFEKMTLVKVEKNNEDKAEQVKKHKVEKLQHTFGSYQMAEEFYNSVSAFFYEMDINGQVFLDRFVENYIKHVEAQTPRFSDVILNTGFTQTIIKKALKGIKNTRQYTTQSFFTDMMEEIKKVCERSNDMSLKITGGDNSFTSIFYRFEPTTKQLTSRSFLDLLIKRGVLKDLGNNRAQFISSQPSTHENSKEKIIELFTTVLERFTHTLIRNQKAKTADEQNFQQTFRSVHVDPSLHDEVRLKLKTMARKHWVEYQVLIDSYEVKTEFEKKRVEETGAELGISAFVYNFNPNEE